MGRDYIYQFDLGNVGGGKRRKAFSPRTYSNEITVNEEIRNGDSFFHGSIGRSRVDIRVR